MATKTWLDLIQAAKKSSIVQDGRTKVHYTFEDSREMVEQYDNRTQVLIERKWKCPTQLGGEGSWTYEVGEAPQLRSALIDDIQESNANPIFSRLDTKSEFQWRIRNLPYPLSTYQLSVEDDGETIVLRTTNKKYFKRFGIPDLHRLGLKLDQNNLTKTHSNNTLVISYKKPVAFLQFEKSLRSELAKTKPLTEGDVPCPTM